MKLLLLRHGETVDNVEGKYAGVTDSSLTNHGIVQARKLGQYLRSHDARIERIFSSDLQRAYLTAEAISESQNAPPAPVIRLAMLREKNFGKYEGTKISKLEVGPTDNTLGLRSNGDLTKVSQETETLRSMRSRANSFIDLHLAPSLYEVPANATVIVVSHGIFLGHIWGELLRCFPHDNVYISPTLGDSLVSLENIKGWHNTAYLELCITKNCNQETRGSNASDVNNRSLQLQTYLQIDETRPISSHSVYKLNGQHDTSGKLLAHMQMTVQSINRRDHLEGFRKTRSGTGNLKYVPRQKTIHSYFAKKS